MYTQKTIRSHIGYVSLVKKSSEVFGSHTRSKAGFQKRWKNVLCKYLYFNGYQSLMTSSRSAIFCLYHLVIYKKTGFKGLWPCVTSKNLRRFFLPNLHTLYDFKWSFEYTFKKYIFLGCVVTFLCFQLTSSELSFITISCKFKGI